MERMPEGRATRVPAETVAGTVIQVRGDRGETVQDAIAHEEPLEIRINDEPWMVVMRTPGQEVAHAAGLLLAEGVIASREDIGTISRCDAEAGNRVIVYLTGQAAGGEHGPGPRYGASRVQVPLSKSSSGLCGKAMISELSQAIRPIDRDLCLTPGMLAGFMEQMVRDQALFAATGGAHAVALYAEDGGRIAFAEDVGRHNAMDKVIGQALLDQALDRVAVAVASSRASFEMVQKAATAGIPIMATVSAPTDLAVDLAQRARMTLIGFLRGDRFTLYTHPQRIRLAE
jgi:FdhD protein